MNPEFGSQDQVKTGGDRWNVTVNRQSYSVPGVYKYTGESAMSSYSRGRQHYLAYMRQKNSFMWEHTCDMMV